jgi:hypothetical protein
VSSRSKRREARNKRRRQPSSPTPVFDPHAQVMVESWAGLTTFMDAFTGHDAPAAAVDAALVETIEGVVTKLRRFDAIRLIEVARQRFLPLTPEGQMPVTAEAGAAYLELLALLALAARQPQTPGDTEVAHQEMSHFVSEAQEDLKKILRLAQLRSFATVDPADKLTLVSLLIRGAEVWMRNSSYPEMVETTNLALLDGHPDVRAALNARLGFDATDALAVLNACHALQHTGLNDRLAAMHDALDAMTTEEVDGGDERLAHLIGSRFMALFEPEVEQATVAVADIAARTGIPVERVDAVVERFRLDLGTASATEAVDAFTTGKNPLRAHPLVVADSGRLMLPHPTLNASAVRENLEEVLKTWAPVRDKYTKHRGDLLESRTRAALQRALPGAHFRDGVEYYLPANDTEAEAAAPAKYTKRTEGDHLIVLDDVALIVEDKAVALSALSRGGKTTRIRTDLTGIITKAANQAGRMREAIARDCGLRTKNEGWIDLSHIREVHTIAVSLDDLSAVSTTTAHLVQADLLTQGNIPWTVSLHDLELITELIDHPAEFLLYLRRRRNPDVTVMFRAVDELDLFLYFYEKGLWVEPDPTQVCAAFPFLGEPTTAQLRRYRGQEPAFLASRTDALDQWFHSSRGTDQADPEPAPKPTMGSSPLTPLLEELQARNIHGWLSISATLLSLATPTQHKFARHGDELCKNPDPNGRERSLTEAVATSTDPAEGWLFVWATRPTGRDRQSVEKKLRGYLRAKKHQLGLPRGALFLYDEPTRALIGAFYDGHTGPLDADLATAWRGLRPASHHQRAIHPNVKRPPRRANNSRRKKRKP